MNDIEKAKKAMEVIKDQLDGYDPCDAGIQIFFLCEVYNMIQVRNITTHPRMKPVPESILDKIIDNPSWLIDKVERAMYNENMFKKPLDYINLVMSVKGV